MTRRLTPPHQILYVNHTGSVSGAELCLLELLTNLPDQIGPTLACPEGRLLEMARARGLATITIPGTDASFRLHPLHTSRGLGWLVATALRLRSIGRRLDASLVHANGTRSGLAAVLASRLGGPPALVHAHDAVPAGRLGQATSRVLRGARVIIANSSWVAAQLQASGGRRPPEVVHNGVDGERFDPARINRDAARAALGLRAGEAVMAVIGQLTPWKGQDDAIRILQRLKPAHPHLRLLLVGSATFVAPGTRFDNVAYEGRLKRLADELGLAGDVAFLGERDDVPEVLRAADLLLVPSWEEPFGRVVLEGMAMALPVAATQAGGPAEVIHDGLDGILLPPRQPERWARAIDALLSSPERGKEMGRTARRRALAEFTLSSYVERVLRVYEETLSEP